MEPHVARGSHEPIANHNAHLVSRGDPDPSIGGYQVFRAAGSRSGKVVVAPDGSMELWTGGTGVQGQYIAPHSRVGSAIFASAPDYSFRVTNAEDMVRLLELQPTSQAGVFTRDGFGGRYILQRDPRSHELSVFYTGGRHQSGRACPPQTFHHGCWDIRQTSQQFATATNDLSASTTTPPPERREEAALPPPPSRNPLQLTLPPVETAPTETASRTPAPSGETAPVDGPPAEATTISAQVPRETGPTAPPEQSQQLAELQRQLEALRGELAAQRETTTRLQTELTRREEEVEGLRTEQQSLTRSLETLRSENTSLERRLAGLQTELEEGDEEARTNLEQTVAALRAEQQTQERERQRQQELERERAAAALQEQQRLREAAEQRTEQLSSEIQRLRDQLSSLPEEARAEAREQIETLQRELRAQQEQRAQEEEERQRREQELQEQLSRELERRRQLEQQLRELGERLEAMNRPPAQTVPDPDPTPLPDPDSEPIEVEVIMPQQPPANPPEPTGTEPGNTGPESNGPANNGPENNGPEGDRREDGDGGTEEGSTVENRPPRAPEPAPQPTPAPTPPPDPAPQPDPREGYQRQMNEVGEQLAAAERLRELLGTVQEQNPFSRLWKHLPGTGANEEMVRRQREIQGLRQQLGIQEPVENMGFREQSRYLPGLDRMIRALTGRTQWLRNMLQQSPEE